MMNEPLAEEILLRRAHESRCARTVIAGDEALEAANEHRGLLRVLAPREVRRGGGGVGAHGSPQCVAARVLAPAPVVESDEAGDSDCDVGLAEAPRPAERVGD